jgi:purine-binding chemotaxis protein CheW
MRFSNCRSRLSAIDQANEGYDMSYSQIPAADTGIQIPNMRPAEIAASAAPRLECISFAIGNDQYGVDIMSVREIKEWSNVTHLPKQPDYVRGVLNLRGTVVPVIDLRCRFGQGLTECTPTHIIIIVQVENRQVGLLADRVLDIVSFERGNLQPVPPIARSARARFLSGLITVDGAMIALIELVSLLAIEIDHPAACVLDA